MCAQQNRPLWNEYYMKIAMAVRLRAACVGNKVGAVLILDRRIVATGYNGTPQDMPNCDEGGCERCANREKYGPGQSYDVCICVHAEQNCLLSSARFGTAMEGAVMYSTMKPCFGCTKELLQAKIASVFYIHDWQHPDKNLQSQYDVIQARFPGGIRHVDIDDPDADWAVSTRTTAPLETGHPIT